MHPAQALKPKPCLCTGGPKGFHCQTFSSGAVEAVPGGGSAVTLTHTSQDGEEGYPGKLRVSVRYELSGHSPELAIRIRATTDQATPGVGVCGGMCGGVCV